MHGKGSNAPDLCIIPAAALRFVQCYLAAMILATVSAMKSFISGAARLANRLITMLGSMQSPQLVPSRRTALENIPRTIPSISRGPAEAEHDGLSSLVAHKFTCNNVFLELHVLNP